MRLGGIARVILSAGLGIAICGSNAEVATRLRVAQTSTVTNCMMSCNSQAATCQTTCVLPPAPAAAGTTTTTAGNATQSTSCQLNCTSQQIACQTNCARTSPSQ